MADFLIAWAPLKEFEGGWCDDPQDRGGETYNGIARNFFPDWEGWRIIDEYKRKYGAVASKLNKPLSANPQLKEYVENWYEKEWWDKLGLGCLPQILANEIFEQAVNMGKAGCGKKLQEVINAWNWNGGAFLFPDLVIDGAIGPKTLKALKILLEKRTDAESIVHALNCMQGAHYIGLAARKASQRVFTRGWMKRTFCEDEKCRI